MSTTVSDLLRALRKFLKEALTIIDLRQLIQDVVGVTVAGGLPDRGARMTDVGPCKAAIDHALFDYFGAVRPRRKEKSERVQAGDRADARALTASEIVLRRRIRVGPELGLSIDLVLRGIALHGRSRCGRVGRR